MLTLAASCAANRPASATQQPLAPASRIGRFQRHSAQAEPFDLSLHQLHQNYTVHRLNELFEAGHPSNSVARAGLVVHQHDNTEGWDAAPNRQRLRGALVHIVGQPPVPGDVQ